MKTTFIISVNGQNKAKVIAGTDVNIQDQRTLLNQISQNGLPEGSVAVYWCESVRCLPAEKVEAQIANRKAREEEIERLRKEEAERLLKEREDKEKVTFSKV